MHRIVPTAVAEDRQANSYTREQPRSFRGSLFSGPSLECPSPQSDMLLTHFLQIPAQSWPGAPIDGALLPPPPSSWFCTCRARRADFITS